MLPGATLLAQTDQADRKVRNGMEERDDLTLLEHIAQRRDRASYAELFTRYEKRAYSLALHLTRNHELAQDAVQNAMLDVWLHAATYRPGNSAGWILRLVANRSIALAKRRKQEGIRMLEPEAAGAALRNPSPADLTEREEQLDVLRASMVRLPLLDRQVLALSFAGGLSQAEIGAALSISRMAISRRLAKACAEIRAHLAQAGYAAVLPLVSAEGLCEAFCSGYAAPPGLRARVLEGASTAVQESLRTAAPRSHRAVAAKTGSGAWVLGIAVTVVAAVGLGALWSAPPKAEPAPTPIAPIAPIAPVAPIVTASPLPVALPRLSRVWDFNSNERPKDLTVVRGEWHHVEKGGPDGSGCMETAEKVCIVLDLPIEQLPVAVTWQSYTQSGFVYSGMWWERFEGEAIFEQKNPPPLETSAWRSSWTPVTAEAVWRFRDIGLAAEPASRCLLSVSLVHRKERARLFVWFGAEGASRIDNLKLESIAPNQAPDLRSFREALEKIPPSERTVDTGEKLLQGSASPVPDKVFSVKFYPKTDLFLSPP